MTKNTLNRTRFLSISALFTALLAVFSQLAIPMPAGVPINLALLAVYLCASLLPLHYSVLSVGAYLLLGLVGVPVFASFRGGVAVLFGKTGGYLIGYLLCAGVIALLQKQMKSLLTRSLVLTLGLLVCYVFGTAWFMYLTKMNLVTSLGYCVLPFLPGDAVKIFAAAWLTPRLQQAINGTK